MYYIMNIKHIINIYYEDHHVYISLVMMENSNFTMVTTVTKFMTSLQITALQKLKIKSIKESATFVYRKYSGNIQIFVYFED